MSAADISFEEANWLHAVALAPSLNPEDVAEVLASGYAGALDALVRSLGASTRAWAAVVDGEVAALLGLAPGPSEGTSVAWCLTGAPFRKHGRAFARIGRGVVAELAELAGGVLFNCVDTRYPAALRWVEWLGFRIGPEVQLGPDEVPFRPVYRR